MKHGEIVKVYLAGPITGLSFKGCTNWRNYAIERLAKKGIVGLSPLRGKEYLSSLKEISGHGRDYADISPLSTPKGVLARDHWDCSRADLILFNLEDAKEVSIGTVMEISWAYAYRKPIVLIVPRKYGHPHDHMMITAAANFIVHSLDDALDLTEAILLPFQVS